MSAQGRPLGSARGVSGAEGWRITQRWLPRAPPDVAGVSGLGRDEGHSHRQTFVRDATGEKFEVPGLFLTEKVVNEVFKITTTHLHRNQTMKSSWPK